MNTVRTGPRGTVFTHICPKLNAQVLVGLTGPQIQRLMRFFTQNNIAVSGKVIHPASVPREWGTLEETLGIGTRRRHIIILATISGIKPCIAGHTEYYVLNRVPEELMDLPVAGFCTSMDRGFLVAVAALVNRHRV